VRVKRCRRRSVRLAGSEARGVGGTARGQSERSSVKAGHGRCASRACCGVGSGTDTATAVAAGGDGVQGASFPKGVGFPAADGQPLLLDFHLSCAPLTSGGSPPERFGGTPVFMAPEQRRAFEAIRTGRPIPDAVDVRSDVYSLGCVLYEIITGEPPFVGESPIAVAYQHVRKDPAPPSQR